MGNDGEKKIMSSPEKHKKDENCESCERHLKFLIQSLDTRLTQLENAVEVSP